MSCARSAIRRLYDLPINPTQDDRPPPQATGGHSGAPVLNPASGREIGPDVRRWAAMLVDSSALTDQPQRVLPDPSFDRFARMVQSALRVPVALVTIVEADRQVFPGAAGLAPGVDARRQTPLSHSFCKHVVHQRAPLVVADARLDSRVSDTLAIKDFGMIAYAGHPITDVSGAVIGSLCALDTEPRAWSERELTALEDLAAACSTEISLREMRRQAVASARDAYEVSYRARVLLALSERLGRTRTLADVSRALLRVAVEDLECSQAGLWVVDSDEATLRYVRDPDIAWPQAEERFAHVRIDDTTPFGAALLSTGPLYFAESALQNRAYPAMADDGPAEPGTARTFLPLIVDGERLGCLVLLWPDQHDFTAEEQVTIGALTTSTAGAIQRARLLADRVRVTQTVQRTLLAELPRPAGIDLAARYQAAHRAVHVGGDWYDVVELPSGAIALTVGDVVGHDAHAAAAMGPLRNMLRAFAWDGEGGPAQSVTRLDHAVGDLHPGVLATILFARIEPGDGPTRRLRWTNAGHPPPILMRPDGTSETLAGTVVDCLLGVVPETQRHDQELYVPSGATLVLFTDGLVGGRREDLDVARARLVAVLAANSDCTVDELADAVFAELVDDQPADDAALLLVRFR
jgi:serine phosphatase RsbU (regulator of sigma subunit)